jgi:hypothetical protein
MNVIAPASSNAAIVEFWASLSDPLPNSVETNSVHLFIDNSSDDDDGPFW